MLHCNLLSRLGSAKIVLTLVVAQNVSSLEQVLQLEEEEDTSGYNMSKYLDCEESVHFVRNSE